MEREQQALWPAVEAAIRTHATWGSPVLLEGWALQPARVSHLALLGFVSLWLIVDERLLEDSLRSDVAFYRGALDEEVIGRKFLARSVWDNTHVREAVSQWGLTAVRVPRRASPDELCEICVGLLANAAATEPAWHRPAFVFYKIGSSGETRPILGRRHGSQHAA